MITRLRALLHAELRARQRGRAVADDIQARVQAQKATLRELRTGLAALGDADTARARDLEQLNHRLSVVGARLENHLAPVEEQAARLIEQRRPGFEEFFRHAQPPVAAGRTLLDYPRLQVIWQGVRNTAALGLSVAEVGTLRGGSAYFIASVLAARGEHVPPIHVFDTFAGHPAASISEADSAHHHERRFDGISAQDVREYLSAFPTLRVHAGDATESVKALPEQQFGFVHLDVDLYRPTLELLEYFGERQPLGGVIVVDDYGAPKCPGVEQAVSEWLSDHEGVCMWQFGTEQAVLIRYAVVVDGRSPHRAVVADPSS